MRGTPPASHLHLVAAPHYALCLLLLPTVPGSADAQRTIPGPEAGTGPARPLVAADETPQMTVLPGDEITVGVDSARNAARPGTPLLTCLIPLNLHLSPRKEVLLSVPVYRWKQ